MNSDLSRKTVISNELWQAIAEAQAATRRSEWRCGEIPPSDKELLGWIDVFERDEMPDGSLRSPDGNGCRVTGCVRIECRRACGWSIVLVEVDDGSDDDERVHPYHCPKCHARHTEHVAVEHWARPIEETCS